jgi:hypothetical protein
MTMGIRRAVPTADSYAPEALDEDETITPAPARRLRATKPAPEPEPEYEDETAEETEEEAPAAPPVRRAKAAAKPAPEPEPEYEDEDEDEVPDNAGIIQSGWGEAKKRLASRTTMTNDFKVTEDEQLIRFITDQPFMFDQHWLKEREGKKSFMCLGKTVCPLCKILGDVPDLKYGFQVVNLSSEEDADPGVQWWIAGTRVFKQLVKFNDKAPINKGYFVVSKSGKGGDTMHAISPVKERDLGEDWGLDVDAVRTLMAGLKPLAQNTLRPPSVQDLREIANEIKRS